MVTTTKATSNPSREAFVVPKPGVNGAVPHSLSGKKFVLTGTFPEIGGGGGLDLGKERLKLMIESFGGRVTSAVSGKTDILVVGKDPGFSKVSKARSNPSIQLMSIRDLKNGIENGSIENINTTLAPITNFSAGYHSYRSPMGNSLANRATPLELAIASGIVEPVRHLKPAKTKTKTKTVQKKTKPPKPPKPTVAKVIKPKKEKKPKVERGSNVSKNVPLLVDLSDEKGSAIESKEDERQNNKSYIKKEKAKSSKNNDPYTIDLTAGPSVVESKENETIQEVKKERKRKI